MANETSYLHLNTQYSFEKRIAFVIINRPEVRNAFNTHLIEELTNVFTNLGKNESLHGIVLTGNGKAFSAGADIQMMQEAAKFTEEQNRQDAQKLANLLQVINTCPCPVIARVQGDAYGGGLGLISVCDIAIATESARFAFSEVKLGIAPAVIAPFVIRKIGTTNARVFFVTGERFSAQRAQQIGLLHSVVPQHNLDDAIQGALKELISSGPQALRASKQLALTVGDMEESMAHRYTTETIARLRTSQEGQEGLNAFLEKRKPNWMLE